MGSRLAARRLVAYVGPRTPSTGSDPPSAGPDPVSRPEARARRRSVENGPGRVPAPGGNVPLVRAFRGREGYRAVSRPGARRSSAGTGRPTTFQKSPSIRSTSAAPRPWMA